jgi:hypothetical protein
LNILQAIQPRGNSVNPEVILISHTSAVWPGARNLFVAETGRHLAITRNPLRDGAARLIEEGFDPKSALVIRDFFDAEPEQRATIGEAAKR